MGGREGPGAALGLLNLTAARLACPDTDRLRAKVEQALVVAAAPRPTASSRRRCASRHPSGGPTRPSTSTTTSAGSRCPSRDRMRDLLDVAATLSSTPLDRSRPLWEFTLVEGLDGRRAALLQRVHHTVTDGVGGLKLSLSLVDFERDPVPDVHDAVRARRRRGAGARAPRPDRGPARPRLAGRRPARRARLRVATERRHLARRGVAYRCRLAIAPDRGAPAGPGRARDGRVGAPAGARRRPGEVAPARDPVARTPLRRVSVGLEDAPRRGARARREHQRRLRHRRRRRRSACTTSSSGCRSTSCGWRWPSARAPTRRPRRGQPVRADARRRAGDAEGAGPALPPGEGHDRQRPP